MAGHKRLESATAQSHAGSETAKVNEAQQTVMLYSVCYFTNRLEPHFDWFMDALAAQSHDLAETQLILVDYWLAPGHPHTKPEGRMERMAEIVDGRCQFFHVPPKPTPWQGKHRQTSHDWFAAANARNTALIIADGQTFVGVDDLSVPITGWWDQIKHASAHGYLAMGAYRKVRDLQVIKSSALDDTSRVVSFNNYENGHDSRWGTGSDGGIVPVTGANLYGCNFALPLERALQVDGFDSWCDRLGAEDYDFGLRVERTGCRCFFNRNMLTYESMEGHEEEPSFKRDKCRVPAERLPASLQGGYPQGLDSDWVMVKALLADGGRTQPLQRNDLKGQRELWRKKGVFKEPEAGIYDWASGLPLSQL